MILPHIIKSSLFHFFTHQVLEETSFIFCCEVIDLKESILIFHGDLEVQIKEVKKWELGFPFLDPIN